MGYHIHIESGNPSDGSLQLSDNGHTNAHKGADVNWHIDDADITSIRIEAKSGSPNIWSTFPAERGNRWTGETSLGAPDNAQWKYSIIWTSSGGGTHTHDPIIAIRPTKSP
jgi:hypothetical protein